MSYLKELKPKEENFMQSLEWYVLNYSWNDKCVKPYNIFHHLYIYHTLPKLLKDFISYDHFKEEMKSLLRYCYRSDSNFEIMVYDLFPRAEDLKKGDKIDVWYQVEPNLDILCRYIITEYNKTKRKKLII